MTASTIPATPWKDIEIGGKKAAFRDASGKRLYVTERNSDRVEAWVAGHKIGIYADIDAAKVACHRYIREDVDPALLPKQRARYRVPQFLPEGVTITFSSAGALKMELVPLEPAKPIEIPADEIERQRAIEAAAAEAQITRLPVDLDPPNGGLGQTFQFREPAPHSEMRVGAMTFNSVEVPTLDEMLAHPMKPIAEQYQEAVAAAARAYCHCGTKLGRRGKCPALCEPVTDKFEYTGPRFVGSTHTGRLGAPVSF